MATKLVQLFNDFQGLRGAPKLQAHDELEATAYILSTVETHEEPDELLFQQIYDALEDYFDGTKLDASKKDVYLKKILEEPVEKTMTLCILFKKNFPEDKEALYNALFGVGPGEHKVDATLHPLQRMAITPTPRDVDKSLPTVDCSLQPQSDTIDLEYHYEPITIPAGDIMRDWETGVTPQIIKRYTTLVPSMYGVSEPKLKTWPEEPRDAINIRVNRSSRRYNLRPKAVLTGPKLRRELSARLAVWLFKKKAWSCGKTKKRCSQKHRETEAKNPVDINFETIKMRNTLMDAWRATFEAKVPLDSNDVLDVIKKEYLREVCYPRFVTLVDSYGVDDVFERKISAAAITFNFTHVLNYEITQLVVRGLTDDVFRLPKERRLDNVMTLFSSSLDIVFDMISRDETMRRVRLPKNITRRRKEGFRPK